MDWYSGGRGSRGSSRRMRSTKALKPRPDPDPDPEGRVSDDEAQKTSQESSPRNAEINQDESESGSLRAIYAFVFRARF